MFFFLAGFPTNGQHWLTFGTPWQSSRKRRIRRIFMPTFVFLRVLFLLGILIYANFFFLLTRLKLLKTPEDDSGSPNLASATKDQKIAANPLPLNKMSSCLFAVGVISFSSQPIRTSHSDCVFIDRTIITLRKFEKHVVDWF